MRFAREVERLGGLLMGYRAMKAVQASAELDLFRLIGRGATARRLAARCGYRAHHVEVLLDALTALGFVRKRGTVYANTPFSREWLMPGGSRSLANNLRCQEFLSQAYADLVDTVRRGRPRRDLRALLSRRPDFVRHYIAGMADISRGPGRELASAVDLTGARDFLDVGAGPGMFTLAALERYPRLRAVALDLPETLVHTRRYVVGSRFADRVAFRAGDYHRADLGESAFDAVLMSHITHDESGPDNLALFRKARRALRPGGRLIVHDFMRRGNGAEPAFSALFALHMITFTRAGTVYMENEYREWLGRAGFRRIGRRAIGAAMPNQTVALIGTREGR